MPSPNQLLVDAGIRHQVGLLRVAGSIRNRATRILDQSESAIRTAVRKLRGATGYARPADVRRIERVVAEVVAARRAAWREVSALIRREVGAATLAEPRFFREAVRRAVGRDAAAGIQVPSAADLRAALRDRAISGLTLQEWVDDARNADLRRIRMQLRAGFAQGESARAISARVVGTVRARGTNGATQVARRNLEAVVRTGVVGGANLARRELYVSNQDLVGQEVWVTTTEMRPGSPCPTCRPLSGEVYPVGDGPIAPLHPNCKCHREPLVDDGGDVDVVDWDDWLQTQPAEFQDDVLGKTRGRLFRDGGLSLGQFVDRKGAQIPLRDLERWESGAFDAAGL